MKKSIKSNKNAINEWLVKEPKVVVSVIYTNGMGYSLVSRV